MGYLVNLLGPQLELGVQLLTFRTPLPNATERQLVHDNPPTNSFDGMQPMSYTAGRTSTLPWQPTSTTVGEAADAGLAASAAPAPARCCAPGRPRGPPGNELRRLPPWADPFM